MSDMKALAALRESVTPGTVVRVVNHDYTPSSGTRKVLAVTDNLYSSGRPGYISSGEVKGKRYYFAWPTETDDFEVNGNELRIYNPSHAYVYGSRAVTLTMRFEFGKGER